ncbi:MAG TPA: hypothetical protein PLY70_06610 [Saprospiraceae bacterium]|nr:hypothetical protein [Saprospiraceae bacterium]HPN69350.1 hypothetical protein [Saprospiraceae bacterium]
MEAHLLLDDQTFMDQFRNGTLNPELFSHEAHLRLAWLHLRKFGEKIALENITSQIIHYVTLLGARDKYNETLTIAAAKTVKHFMEKQEIDDFQEFIQTYPRLKFQFKDLLFQHYKVDIFNNEKAKSEFLEPDLLPFS